MVRQGMVRQGIRVSEPGPRKRQVPLLSRTAIDWGLMLTGIPLCLLARGANIFPLSALLNLRRALPLPLNLQARPGRPGRPGLSVPARAASAHAWPCVRLRPCCRASRRRGGHRPRLGAGHARPCRSRSAALALLSRVTG